MKVSGQVIVSKQWKDQKSGKSFVTIQVTVLGFGVCKWTVDEKLIPDQLEGRGYKVDLVPHLNEYQHKLELKPNWSTFEVE